MKPKYIKFILPLILSSVVSALFGCSNKTPSNEDMIINKFNSLKNGNYTFTYTLNDGTNTDNYNISKVEGKLTVTPINTKITITAASGSKQYDGTPLTNTGYTYTDDVLVAGDVFTALVAGTIASVDNDDNVVN